MQAPPPPARQVLPRAVVETPVPAPPAAVLRATGISKRFGKRLAVDDVSFHIAEGETYGLLGPNGAGKTTSISMVCGILNRDAGEVIVHGQRLTPATTSAKAAIGYVPQDLAIYPDLSATENLRFFGRLYGMKGTELTERIAEVLEVIGLTDRAKDRTEKYSGGMKRRLNIGIGLLHRPKLLVLDEPTVGVDPQSRNAILESVEQLSAKGMAILYTTHYMEEAERLCDRVGIIDQGRVIAEGTRRELVALVGQLDKVMLTADGRLAEGAAAARAVGGVREATVQNDRIDVLATEARSILPRLLGSVTDAGVVVHAVEVIEPDLEAVFLHLTGKALRA
jgi:ABC-2 type transport system ATP-binding protein